METIDDVRSGGGASDSTIDNAGSMLRWQMPLWCSRANSVQRLRRIMVGLFFISLMFIGLQLLKLQSHPAMSKSSLKTTGTSIENIPLNAHAQLAQDVISILHYSGQAKLEVTMSPSARCPRPYLVGRLNGPALVKIDNWTWTGHDQQNGTSAMIGQYHAPVGGLYFLEIVVLYCNDLYYGLKKMTSHNYQNSTRANQTINPALGNEEDWLYPNATIHNILKVDFTNACMEDPLNHRLTETNTVLQVQHVTAQKLNSYNNPAPHYGFWFYNSSRTTWDNPEDQPTHAPTRSPSPTSSFPKSSPTISQSPTTSFPTEALASLGSQATRPLLNCKMYMMAGDKNADGYMDASGEYIDWLNKMSLPIPAFVGATFDMLPITLQSLYGKYTDQYSATDEIDIHGTRLGTEPTSPEQGASLDELCAEATLILAQLKEAAVVKSQANAVTRGLRTLAAEEPKKNPPLPIYTRYQTQHCWQFHHDHLPLPSECQAPASVHRFDPYEFRWVNNGLTVQDLQQSEPTVICIMGHSHARTLWHAGERLGLVPTALNGTNISIEWTDAHYPHEVNPGSVRNYISQKKCSKLIIAVGQWPASYVRGFPTGLVDYYVRIKSMLTALVEHNITQQIDISMRSIHYNPPNFVNIPCPPKDWRNPMVLDAYNAIIQKVCRELSIPFWDTNFLVGPVWDAAPDWCHLSNHTSEQEMLYLAASVLGI